MILRIINNKSKPAVVAAVDRYTDITTLHARVRSIIISHAVGETGFDRHWKTERAVIALAFERSMRRYLQQLAPSNALLIISVLQLCVSTFAFVYRPYVCIYSSWPHVIYQDVINLWKSRILRAPDRNVSHYDDSYRAIFYPAAKSMSRFLYRVVNRNFFIQLRAFGQFVTKSAFCIRD